MDRYIIPAAIFLLIIQEIRIIGKKQRLRRIKKTLRKLTNEKEKLLYENNQTLRMYRRFAPWKLPELLRQLSLVEMTPEGEINSAAAMDGVMGMITMEQTQLSRVVHMCRCQREQNGVLLADNLNLTSWKLLFLNRPEAAIQYGIDIISHEADIEESISERERANGVTILLHHTSFQYGIAGNSRHAYPFLLSKEADALQNYLLRLRESNVKMVITKKVHDALSSNIKSRYIGYLESEELMETAELYEILDTCTEPERTQKLKANESFQNGLQLYYKNDFYLSRSYFAKVIRECPTDLIAKWYIFSCEKMINEVCEEEHFGLFRD